MQQNGSVRELNEEETAYLNYWRITFSNMIPDQQRSMLDTTDGKLEFIQQILNSGQATVERPDLLQGLGVMFGDALAAELDLKWAALDDGDDPIPVVIRPGTSFRAGALFAIEKRVRNDEVPIDARALFGGFCAVANDALRPKKSLWGRLFGSRLV